MFIIRMKQPPSWAAMKTPVGLLMVAFTTQRLADAYLHALKDASNMVAVERDTLLISEPTALDGIQQVLLFPSIETIISFFRDSQTFPYQDYVVELSPVT